MATVGSQDTPPRRSLFARVVRFPLKIVILIIVLLVRSIARHPRVSAAAVVAAGALVYAGFATSTLTMPKVEEAPTPVPETVAAVSAATPGDSNVPAITTQAPMPSPQAPIEYLRAMSKFDAQTMWNLLSPVGQASQGSEAQLQQRVDATRSRIGTIKEITYVGGSKLRDGSGVYVYVLTIQAGDQITQGSFTAILDANGKISRLQ